MNLELVRMPAPEAGPEDVLVRAVVPPRTQPHEGDLDTVGM
jgi:hypothetical protein